jgi:hypothetical protein
MVLAYLGERVDEERLRQRLGTVTAGTFFFNVDRLRSWWLAVERDQGDRMTLEMWLAAGHPVIVPVDTGLLPYWLTRPDVADPERVTDHAVVVVGLDDQHVSVNDPDFAVAPQVVEWGWFLDAWRNHDQWYAVIRRRWAWRLWRPSTG